MKKLLVAITAFLLCTLQLFAQQVQLTGRVTSSADETPLPGVNVIEKGTTNGAVTDLEGNFALSVAGSDAILIFSYVGFVVQEVPVGNQTDFNVILEEDYLRLDEVVVTGYGVSRKSDLTAAISSVSTEDLPPSASLSINNMLQGRVAGVDITAINGMPGAGVSIKIRGVSTINNSEPLYIIDGVFMRNDPNRELNPLSMMNPNDIERIEILKDAASSAIYGASGANGVVYITTKKGKTGKTQVNFRTQFGVAATPKKLDILKADPYVDLLIEQQQAANPNSPINEVVGPTVLNESYSRVDRTDWQDEVFRNAAVFDADLDLSGGTQNASYMFSVGYADQDAIVIGGDFKRYTSRLATDFKIGKRVKIGQNFNFSHTNRRDVNNAGRGLIVGALRMAPYVPVYDDNNWWGFGNNNNVNDNNNADNPRTSVHYETDQHKNWAFWGNVFGEVEIIQGLTYLATLSLNYSQHYRNRFLRQHVNSNEFEPGALEENYSWGLWPRFEQTLTYAKSIDRHDFTLLAGMSVDRNGIGRSITVSGSDFPNENLTNIELAGNSTIASADVYVGSGLSYFGRLNYSFDNKYLITAIIRRDGSDKFSSTSRWGTFPAVSVAWKLHQENFFASAIPAINTMKLRAGWGVVGIDAIGSFQYSSYIHSVGMSYPVGYPGSETYLTGATIKALSSPDIKWEEATTLNIGLDMGFLRNKLTATIDVFSKETTDILVEVPTSPSMGLGLTGGEEGGSRIANAATATNKGIEALVKYMNYDREFKFGITGTFTYIKNEVTGLGQGEPITGPSYNGQAHMTYTNIGHPIGSFYGFKVDKIYANQGEINADNAAASEATDGAVAYYQSDLTAPGDIRFQDLDGNGYINDEDRDYIGCPIPKYSYGLVFDAEYKGFDLSMNLSGVAGVDIYSAFYTWNLLGMRVTGNHLTDVSDRWTTSNTNASLPRAISNDPNNNLRTSDRYVYNGAFLKFRTISLGYTLPTNLLSSIGISRLRVYATAQNPITISDYIGYDPEVSSYNENDANGYNLGRGIDQGFTPIPRTYLLGVQVSF